MPDKLFSMKQLNAPCQWPVGIFWQQAGQNAEWHCLSYHRQISSRMLSDFVAVVGTCCCPDWDISFHRSPVVGQHVAAWIADAEPSAIVVHAYHHSCCPSPCHSSAKLITRWLILSWSRESFSHNTESIQSWQCVAILGHWSKSISMLNNGDTWRIQLSGRGHQIHIRLHSNLLQIMPLLQTLSRKQMRGTRQLMKRKSHLYSRRLDEIQTC